MSWQPYGIDDCARQVVLNALQRDASGDSLNQVFKMRLTCAYGLERFWGEYLRLRDGNQKEKNKAAIIHDTWRFLKESILSDTGINLPFEPALDTRNKADVRNSLQRLWELRTNHPHQAQTVLAVLVVFCDAIIWWKNRLSAEEDG
jgi:hypothetical protein